MVTSDPAKNAIILSGGGSKAGFQVGFLKALASYLDKDAPCPFGVLCGISAGAMNATGLASHAHEFRTAVHKLEQAWLNLTVDHVYNMGSFGLLSSLSRLFGSRDDGCLLDPTPLGQLIDSQVQAEQIARHLEPGGPLSALVIHAYNYHNGRNTAFIQSERQYKFKTTSLREARRAVINREHILASSALPYIFPHIPIGEQTFGDGGMGHHYPFSTPIHLGATRIIGISMERPEPTSHIAQHLISNLFPTSLLTDQDRVRLVNQQLAIMPTAQRLRDPRRHVTTLVIKPDVDFRDIAVRHFAELPRSVRLTLRSIGINRQASSAFLHYMLFSPAYSEELIAVGEACGHKYADQVLSLLASDDQQIAWQPMARHADQTDKAQS